MAKKPKASSKVAGIVPDQHIVEVPLAEWAQENYIDRYAKMTLESRAIPDIYDGLLPSERRAIWAALQVRSSESPNKFYKSARIVGDMIGKFHPHGDTAAYGTIVKSTRHLANPYFIGQGNWGSVEDPKGFAAMRYTECRLSDYALKVMLQSDYLAVTQMIPNFDGSQQEPFVLPALLPNLLLNGAYGVATGATTYVPAFAAEGVIALIQKALKGKKIKLRDCINHLEFVTPYGGVAVVDPDDEGDAEELAGLYENGRGSIYFSCDYTLDEDNHAAYVRDFVPYVGIPKALERIGSDERVAALVDASDIDPNGQEFVAHRIVFKRSVSKQLLGAVADEVLAAFDRTQSFRINVNERVWDEFNGKAQSTFGMMGVIDIVEKWTAWRLALEQRYREYLNTKLEQRNWQLDLLILAGLNLDVIVAGLRRDDTEAYLMKQLKLDEAQVEFLVNRKIIQLKKLSQEKLKAELKSNKEEIKRNKELIKDPTPAVDLQLKDFLKQL